MRIPRKERDTAWIRGKRGGKALNKQGPLPEKKKEEGKFKEEKKQCELPPTGKQEKQGSKGEGIFCCISMCRKKKKEGKGAELSSSSH